MIYDISDWPDGYYGYHISRGTIVGVITLYCTNSDNSYACPSWVQAAIAKGYHRMYGKGSPPNVPPLGHRAGPQPNGYVITESDSSYDTQDNPDGVVFGDSDPTDNRPYDPDGSTDASGNVTTYDTIDW